VVAATGQVDDDVNAQSRELCAVTDARQLKEFCS
jgi:hypothetical protein